MLEHGGRLLQAAAQYQIEPARWLDLSTGVAPFAPPLPAIDASAWHEMGNGIYGAQAAARAYYGRAALLPVAGSQAAIQALPRLRRPGLRVGVVSPAYAEHALAWRREGHLVQELSEGTVERDLEYFDLLLVINPNNPSGRLIERQRLLGWHARLAERGGWLVVDEAFMDCTPEHSLAAESQRQGLIVLRSFGKFFGLAGMRLGFALGGRELLGCLQRELGPWTLSGPTRLLGRSLLADVSAQQTQRAALLSAGERLADLLRRHRLAPLGGCALFQWLLHAQAAQLFDFCARRGILLRLYRAPLGLRFGLPADEAGWQRLEQALQERPAWPL